MKFISILFLIFFISISLTFASDNEDEESDPVVLDESQELHPDDVGDVLDDNDVTESEEESQIVTLEALGIPTMQSSSSDEIDGNSTVEVENSDLLLIDESGNSTETVNGSTTNATSTVRPKRIACLRPEPKITPEVVETDVEDDDGNDQGQSEVRESLSKPSTLDEPGVKVVNGSFLLQALSEQYNSNVTNRSTPAECSLVFFYARWCPFSAEAASHFNAMGRIYTDLPIYAVDSSRYPGVNTQFGILALPTILLFHNSKPVSKFNHTIFNLDNYAQFLSTLTGIEANGLLEVTETDQAGPLPTVAEVEPDYYLYLAWLFTIVCGLGYFSKSSFSKRLIESVQNNWREVEIQHEHID